jgi:hypothetical protein
MMESFEKKIASILEHQLQLYARILKKSAPVDWYASEGLTLSQVDNFAFPASGRNDDDVMNGIESMLNNKLALFALHLGKTPIKLVYQNGDWDYSV